MMWALYNYIFKAAAGTIPWMALMTRAMSILLGTLVLAVPLLAACQLRGFTEEPQIEHQTPDQMYSDPRVRALVKGIIELDPARVTKLAQSGANVNASPDKGVVPLLWASEVRCKPCIKSLLDAKADPWLKMDISGQSAVEMVLERNDRSAEQLPIFLKAGLDVNHPVSDGRDVTLLGIAAFNGPLETVKGLVTAGADINFHGPSYFADAVGEALDGGRFDVIFSSPKRISA